MQGLYKILELSDLGEHFLAGSVTSWPKLFALSGESGSWGFLPVWCCAGVRLMLKVCFSLSYLF